MTGRQALAKMYGEGAMVSHASLGCAIKIVDRRVVDQDCNPIPEYLRAWFVADLESEGWFEVEKPKVVANGLAELFEKSIGEKRFWIGEDKVCYFVSGSGHLGVYDYPGYPFLIDPSFLHQKFTLIEKEDKT